MKTKVESMQPRKKLEGKRVFSILAAVVAAMMLAAPAPAATNAVSDAMWASVDQLVQAAAAAGGSDSASALTALNDAEDFLNQAKDALPTSGFSTKLVSKLGKGIDATNKKLATLDSQFESLSEKSAVSKLSSAANSLQKLANLAGRPLLEEVTPNNSAGFLKAGAMVTMAYAIPPGCTDVSVHVTAAPGVIAGDPIISPDGTITIIMGSTQGGADVSVRGCGCAIECCSRELYNYGGPPAKPVSGLPDGFPTNLTPGKYLLTYSGLVGAITCCSGSPPTCNTSQGIPFGPIVSPQLLPLTNVKTFAALLEKTFNTVMAAYPAPSGCTQKASFSPINDTSFTMTYSATCSSSGCTPGTATFQLTLQKQ